jgi:CBS domain containing-hemolysin-like protein
MVVPESKQVSQMLDEFREAHSHLAMVVDEFGTIVGMVTVEDVLEQIVGRIEDEHDEKVDRLDAENAAIELDGATRIRELESEYEIELPLDAGFETLAGFLLFKLGEIPAVGDHVDHEGRRYTVVDMERNRISRVRIEKLPKAMVQDAPPVSMK